MAITNPIKLFERDKVISLVKGFALDSDMLLGVD